MNTTPLTRTLFTFGWLAASLAAFAQEGANVTQFVRDSQAALADGKIDEATRIGRRAVDLDPAHPPAWRQYGLALLRSGNAEEAAAALKRAVALDEGEATAWRGLALASWQTRQENEAVRALSAYLRLKPDDAPAWRDLAGWLTRLERGDEAVAALRRGTALTPDDASVWRDLGAWEIRLKHDDQAVEALGHATQLKPDDASAWRDLASVHLRRGQHEPALAALERVTALKPDDVSALRDLATTLTRLGRHDLAAAALERVTQLRPDDADAWREWAHALARLERASAALAAFERAAKLAPQEATTWRALAALYEKLNRPADALQALERALAAKPGDAATLRDLGWALWFQGQRDPGVSRLTEAVEAGVEARDRVVYQVAARLSEEGQGEQAITFLRRVNPQAPLSGVGLALAKGGRLRAADPLLQAAWQGGEKSPVVGLYLAYARAVNAQFAQLGEHLEPLLASPDALAPEYADLALEVLRLGGKSPEAPALAERLEQRIGQSERFGARVTDILEAAAESRRASQANEQALALYRRVLARDPERACWLWAVLLAERVEGKSPWTWLDEYAKRAKSPARQTGVRGLLAERQGRPAEAIDELSHSLALDPEQHALRQILFSTLLGQGRIGEARAQADWFARKVEGGESVLRSYLAEMLTRLGDTPAALAQWEVLSQGSPDVSYYAVEHAQALVRLNRADEAVQLLTERLARTPDTRIFETLVDIAALRADARAALDWSTRGLEAAPSQSLLRSRAEALEQLGTNAPSALADALAFLKRDPGNVPVSLLAARLMEATGATDDSRAFHRSLLVRSPDFVPSLTALRDDAARVGRIDDAAPLEQVRAGLLPRDLEAARGFASLLAQQQRFHRALNQLRPLAAVPLEQAVPVLAYGPITRAPYPGRNSVDQIARHVKALAKGGYVFINAFRQLAEKPGARAVMLVLLDPDADVIEALDPVLQQCNARVVYAGNAETPALTLAGTALSAKVAPALASGRWRLASGGPAGQRRGTVDATGLLGEPLTHRLLADGASETPDAAFARIDRALDEAGRALAKQDERILVYPSGDFGQRSLDTDAQSIEALRRAVGRHFTHAVYLDATGYTLMDDAADPLRISARLVPASWDESALTAALTAGHPLTRIRTELARILYWDGQHEAAHAAFERAVASGASRDALALDEGLNADRQGDVATARARLLAAQAANPDSERIRAALDRLEDRRRPQATLYVAGWMDNEHRDHFRYGGYADAYVAERLRLGVLADRDRWSTKRAGDEWGSRYGLRGLAFLSEEIWLSGSLWALDMDDQKDHWGGDLALRLPNPWLSGYLYLTASREEIETVEALRANIDANTYALRTYTRLCDVWDLFADLSETMRSDGNNTTMLDGRLLYRIQAWPYVGVGWRFRVADSDRDPPEYWAPEGLQQHQAHITVRGASGRLSYSASAEAGMAEERDTNWQFVWGARGTADYALSRRLSVTADLGYFESTGYNRTYGRLALTGRF